jgi:hypothetical protein
MKRGRGTEFYRGEEEIFGKMRSITRRDWFTRGMDLKEIGLMMLDVRKVDESEITEKREDDKSQKHVLMFREEESGEDERQAMCSGVRERPLSGWCWQYKCPKYTS